MSFQPEFRLIRMRPRVTALGWPTLTLAACAFALSALGNRLPEPWMQNALYAAAGAVVTIFWLFPVIRYAATYFEVTSTRVIVRRGLFGGKSFELNIGDVSAVKHLSGGKVSLTSKSGEEFTLGPISKSKLIAAELAKLSNTPASEMA